MVRNLRRVSIIEAVSYLILVLAAVVKRVGGTETGVTVMGPVHGILFLAYAGMLLRDHRALGWPLRKAVAAMIIGSLPFGGFWVEHQWLAPLDEVRGGGRGAR